MYALRLILLSCCALPLVACGGGNETASGDTNAPAATSRSGSDKFPVYTETGTINVVNGTAREKYFTTFNTVPGQPGREIHTASWITMTGTGLPNDIFVSLSARPAVEPDTELPELKIEFSLEPESLQVKEGVPVKVAFTPGGESRHDELSNAVLTLDQATRVDEDTLALAGRVAGEMKGKPFSATFAIDKARNRASK